MKIESNPWYEFANNYQCKECIKASVSQIKDFGIFVLLEGGIEGIVHLGDIDWTEPGEKIIKRYKISDVIETMILKIEPERKRISLSIKHLSPRPDPNQPGDPTDPVPVKPNNSKPPNSPLKTITPGVF